MVCVDECAVHLDETEEIPSRIHDRDAHRHPDLIGFRNRR